jgi:tRNA threonylcarbamoyladenosine dehydratase
MRSRAADHEAEAVPGTPILDLERFGRALESSSPPSDSAYRPWIVRLEKDQAERLAALCGAHRIKLIDTIHRQLAELAAVRLPAGAPADRHLFIETTARGAGDLAAVGNWVYVPWEAKIAHLLDRDGYFDVITNRNADKITPEEQRLLRTKRVGVIGLSVGGEAAVTVAQEHLCGEIILADFDRLDLSNLNRLHAGFDELGLQQGHHRSAPHRQDRSLPAGQRPGRRGDSRIPGRLLGRSRSAGGGV